MGAQQPQPLSVHFRLGLGQWRQRRLDWSRLELSNKHVWAVSLSPSPTLSLQNRTKQQRATGLRRCNISLARLVQFVFYWRVYHLSSGLTGYFNQKSGLVVFNIPHQEISPPPAPTPPCTITSGIMAGLSIGCCPHYQSCWRQRQGVILLNK